MEENKQQRGPIYKCGTCGAQSSKPGNCPRNSSHGQMDAQ